MKPINDKFLWDMIDRLRDDINCHIDAITDMDAVINELKADNKRNVDKFEMRVETLKNEVEEGRAENRRLYQEHKECRDALEEQVSDLMIDKDRLVEQVSSNSGNSSSTHTHTKETEIDAEMIDKHGNVKAIKCYTKDM